jgi:hypothetical protein
VAPGASVAVAEAAGVETAAVGVAEMVGVVSLAEQATLTSPLIAARVTVAQKLLADVLPETLLHLRMLFFLPGSLFAI